MKKWSLKKKTFLSVGITLAAIGAIFLGSFLYSKVDKRSKNINAGIKSNAFNDFDYDNGVYTSYTQGIFYDANKNPLAYVKEKEVNGKKTKNTICFYNEDKEYDEKEFFNEFVRRYNNQTPILKVKLGPTEFVNEYLEAVGVQDFMDYVDWFIQNVAWGPDVLTLEKFRIAKGVNKSGSTITLGGHVSHHKETKEITFWPDSFFGSLPLFSQEAGEGNASDSLLSKINAKSINATNVQNLLDEFVMTNAVYNYPGEINKKPDYENSVGQFKNIKLVNLMTNPNLNYHFFEVELTKKNDKSFKQKVLMSLGTNDINEARKQIPAESEFEILDQTFKQVRVVRTNFIKNDALPYAEKNDKKNFNLSLGYIHSDASEANQVGKYSPLKADDPRYIQLVSEHEADPVNHKHPGKPTNRILLNAAWDDPAFASIYENINSYLESKIQTFKDFVNFKIYLTDFNKLYSVLKKADTPLLYNVVTYYNSDDKEIDKKVRRELYLYTKPNASRFELTRSLFKSKEEAKKAFGSKFDETKIKKVTLLDLKVENKTLIISLENQDKSIENIEIRAEDSSMQATNQLTNLKNAVDYKVAYAPNFLSITNEYKDSKGEKVYEFDLYNELYADLIDIIENEYPYLVQKKNGVHIKRSIDENGAYKFSLEYGEYSKLTVNDRVSFIMLLKAIDPNFEGVGINFLKYVGAHEYGHHSTLENIQNISNKDYSVLIGGIDTRGGPQDQSFYDKDTVREYLLARSSKLDILNKNLAFSDINNEAVGNYPVFSTISVVNGKLKITPETEEDIWGSTNANSAEDYYKAFNNKQRRALQTIDGLREAAKLRGLKIYDLFLLNSFDHDSGTISPSISGEAKYYATEEDSNGNVLYTYKFVTAGSSQIEKILKDGTGKPIKFVSNPVTGTFEPVIFETKQIVIKDGGLPREATLVTKVLINDINGEPIYKLDQTKFEDITDPGHPVTVYGELMNVQLRDIKLEVEEAISKMMDKSYYINGWQNSDHRGDDNLKMPTFALNTTWAPFTELKTYFDSVLNYVKQYPGTLSGAYAAMFSPELIGRFDVDNPNFFGKPNYFHFIASRDGQTPIFDADVQSKKLADLSNTYNKKLDYYKDIPTLTGSAVLASQLSKLFADYVKTNSHDNTWHGQKEKFGVLRFINEDNSIKKKYFGNTSQDYGFFYKGKYTTRINEFGVEAIFNVLFKNNQNLFDMYADDIKVDDLKQFLPYINSETVFSFDGMQQFNTPQKRKQFMDLIVNKLKTVNNLRLKEGYNGAVATLFGDAINSKYWNNNTLKFTDVADLVEFMSFNSTMFKIEDGVKNYNINYVKTKFDLAKFREFILASGEKEEKELLTKNNSEQNVANIAMSRFLASSFYAFNTDIDLIDFSKDDEAEIKKQKIAFAKSLNELYKNEGAYDIFESENIVSDEYFNTTPVNKKIALSTSILFDKLFDQAKTFFITNNILGTERGKLSLSDLPFIDGKFERLHTEFLSIYGINIYMLQGGKISAIPIDKSAYTYSFSLDNSINTIAKTFFTSRLNTDLGQIFTDYTYNLPEVLTRDYVQTTYTPSTSDFRTLNKYFKGINEYTTGLEFFVNGQITKHFVDNSANMNKVNQILAERSYMVKKEFIEEKIKENFDNDPRVASLRDQLNKAQAEYDKMAKDAKNNEYFEAKKDYDKLTTQIKSTIDHLHNVNEAFHMTNLNKTFATQFSASLISGPFAAEVQSFIDAGTFQLYFGKNNDANGLNSANANVDIKILSIVPNSGDDVEGTLLLTVRLSLKGTSEDDINNLNSLVTTVKMYGFKNAYGVASVSPIIANTAETQKARKSFLDIVDNLTNLNSQLKTKAFNSVKVKPEFKAIEELDAEIKLKTKIIDDLVKPINEKIRKENSFGLFGASEFTLSSANPSYLGKVRKQNNGFFKDRWLRKELGWELYDEEGNSVVDDTLRIKDLDGNFVNDRARAFWIYLLKSKGVGDRNITGIWRNKANDFVAMWGFDKKEVIDKIKYLEFEDTVTGEKFYINVNTKNTNNLFYYKKQARIESKHTLEDEGYGSWVSDYSVIANYKNTVLTPGHNYLVRFVDKDKNFVKNLTTGSKRSLAENGKTYNQSPITMKTIIIKHNGIEEEIALLEVRDQFNL
ncbi:Uncharacterised protein [Mycoplasmopsis californica]|uniref:PDxFFG protein n=1 Tax=Mycoplasmopsis equigenitalium TaxID=114883 RepID=A0ABY5J1V3_9BACT|nr:PDxFFG protein [Mycoplasmopsis equigenitalium]UUD36975.1 PDxFFG protein [Mycoplasmopsis equigenitalium]VEU69729.1 Uncharacterised protein [Mycoplasmopsis californica]